MSHSRRSSHQRRVLLVAVAGLVCWSLDPQLTRLSAGERVEVTVLEKRERKGADWTDGDCYKWIEAMARQFAVTGDPELSRKMDYWIGVIAQAQSADGYLSTNLWDDPEKRLEMPYRHGMYNMGHLLTAASVHYQMTGKTTFLSVALTRDYRQPFAIADNVQ